MGSLTRRAFVTSAALGAIGTAGVVAAGITAAQAEESASAASDHVSTQASDDIQWVDEADVIVVGGGGAGFSAAIEAANSGASVLILEKAGFCGGDTQLSNGMIMAAGTPEQEELAGCTTDTPEAFAEQQVTYAQGMGNEEMIREMCMESPHEVEFMKGLGIVYKNVDIIPPVWGYDTETSWGPRSHWDHYHVETSAEAHFGRLRTAVNGIESIRVQTETEVAHLITGNDEVIGVSDTLGNCYRANKGVVLATASFGANKEMNRRYNHMMYWALCLNETYAANYYECHAANTGDGIRMAQEIGADLALSPSNVILDKLYIGGVGDYFQNLDAGIDYTNPYLSAPIPGMILVNSAGNRFVQEDALWGYVNQEVYKQAMQDNWNAENPGIRVWAIQDSTNLQNSVTPTYYAQDTESNYGKLIKSADTIEELATQIGVPAENLVNTVERWNQISTEGVDPDFDRRTDFGTIETGPFYAFPYIPETLGSLGGLATDVDANVLHVSGKPIPRLYAAGTVMSGMWCGPFYSSCGWAILGTVHWGRKAARNIVALEPWTTDPIEPAQRVTKQLPEPQPGNYTAGTYEAVATGRNGEVPVTVEFSDTEIVSITIGENAETQEIGSAAIDLLPERIIEAQSTDIDALTGATLTSMAIFLAVDDCIDQASK